MANYIGRLVALITADTAGFTAGVNRAKGETAAFKASAETGFLGARGAISSLGSALSALAPELMALGTTAGAIQFGRTFIRDAMEIANTAEFLGMTTDQFQRLSLTARLAGLDMDGATRAILTMQGGLDKAIGGTLEYDQALKILQVDAKRLALLDTAGQVALLTKELHKVEDIAARNVIGAALFGPRGYRGGMGEVLMEFGKTGGAQGPILSKQAIEEWKGAGRDLKGFWNQLWATSGEKIAVWSRGMQEPGRSPFLLGLMIDAEANRKFHEDQARRRNEAGAAEKKQVEDGLKQRQNEFELRKKMKMETESTTALKAARTEEEKFADATRQAYEWAKAGVITREKEAELIGHAQKMLLKSWTQEVKIVPGKLVRRGTAEEFELVSKVQMAIVGRNEELSRLAAIEANTKRAADAAEAVKDDKIKTASLPP
jgi:hypothetical protein